MANQKGGRKLARGTKHQTMYAAQFFRTAKNKTRRATKRANTQSLWRTRGVKKDGTKVKGS